jgi:LacI family transcriptional regulator
LRLLAPRETAGAAATTRKTIELIVMETPDLVGMYNAGGEHEDAAAVIGDMGLRGRVTIIGHGFSAPCRRLLQCGALDAVIGVNTVPMVSAAARFLLAHRTGEPLPDAGAAVGVEIMFRDNLL